MSPTKSFESSLTAESSGDSLPSQLQSFPSRTTLGLAEERNKKMTEALGIGRAIAIRLGRDSALVAVHYGRNKKAADGTVHEIEAAGGAAFLIGAELGTVASVEQLFKLRDRS